MSRLGYPTWLENQRKNRKENSREDKAPSSTVFTTATLPRQHRNEIIVACVHLILDDKRVDCGSQFCVEPPSDPTNTF